MNQSIHEYKYGIRHHKTPIGLLPGVTSVLAESAEKDKAEGIHFWKCKLKESLGQEVGEQVADGILANSSNRGTIFHGLIEEFLGGGEPTTDHLEAAQLFKQILPLLKEIKRQNYDAQHIKIEQHTYHSLGYAGTPDLIARYDGNLTVFDWKNSRKPKKRGYIRDYLLQVAAYCMSANETFGLDINQAIIAVSVYPDEFLQYTDPDLTVEPELQVFKLTPKQLAKDWVKFQARLEIFKEKMQKLDALNSFGVEFW